MKKGNKGLLIGIGILVLVAIVGIALFFAFANQKTEIYVTSFDKQVTFSIGKYSVDSFQCSTRDGNSITKSKDAQTILNMLRNTCARNMMTTMLLLQQAQRRC